jgi:hypothetical protein
MGLGYGIHRLNINCHVECYPLRFLKDVLLRNIAMLNRIHVARLMGDQAYNRQ